MIMWNNLSTLFHVSSYSRSFCRLLFVLPCSTLFLIFWHLASLDLPSQPIKIAKNAIIYKFSYLKKINFDRAQKKCHTLHCLKYFWITTFETVFERHTMGKFWYEGQSQIFCKVTCQTPQLIIICMFFFSL